MDQAAAATGSSKVVKHKQGKPLNSGERQINLNVFNKCSEEYSSLLVTEETKLEFTGVFSVQNPLKQLVKLQLPERK
jgi:hypothetical protein